MAEQKAADFFAAFEKEREELVNEGAWWDADSVVARLKERMHAKVDKYGELWTIAVTKRHEFEECCAKNEADKAADKLAEKTRELADMKFLTEFYDEKEERRKASWARKAAEEEEELDILRQLRALRAQLRAGEQRVALLEREGAVQRELLAMYD